MNDKLSKLSSKTGSASMDPWSYVVLSFSVIAPVDGSSAA